MFEKKSEAKKNKLDLFQQNAIQKKDGNFLLLAGAGSGKTKIIIERIMFLCNYVNISEILCLTFSNLASKEILHRLKNKTDQNAWIGTFHGISFRILQYYGLLNNKIRIIDEYEVRDILLNNIATNKSITELYKNKNDMDFQLYKSYCDNNNIIDFTGILYEFEKNLKENITFRNQVINKFKYIMVDEYQDTSVQQMNILKLIVKNNLFCVGDDDQAIYEWRGANIENILDFSNHFDNVEILYLKYNYRCTKEIVGFANDVIKFNRKRYLKDIKSTKNGVPVQIYSCNYKKNTDVIYEIIENSSNDIKSIGILCRLDSSVRQYEGDLISKGVSVSKKNQLLKEYKNVKIIMSYLSLLVFNDIDDLNIVMRYPKRKIGKAKIEKIIQKYEENNDLMQSIKEIVPQEFDRLITLKEYILKNNNDVEKILLLLIKETQVEIDIYVARLMEIIKNEDNINNFIQNITENDIFFEKRTINVMTIHSAKGLEFDLVIIPSCIEGYLPCMQSIISGEIEQERRVMYVAITRAKKELNLTYDLRECKRNFIGKSRFICDINSNYVNLIIR